jgi:hypothetical protein
MKRIVVTLIALSLAGPAMAMGTTRNIPTEPTPVPTPTQTQAPNPVTVAMKQELTGKFNVFMKCIGARTFELRTDIAALERANNEAGHAAMNRDLVTFKARAATVDTELARLNPKYGC